MIPQNQSQMFSLFNCHTWNKIYVVRQPRPGNYIQDNHKKTEWIGQNNSDSNSLKSVAEFLRIVFFVWCRGFWERLASPFYITAWTVLLQKINQQFKINQIWEFNILVLYGQKLLTIIILPHNENQDNSECSQNIIKRLIAYYNGMSNLS